MGGASLQTEAVAQTFANANCQELSAGQSFKIGGVTLGVQMMNNGLIGHV